MIGPKVFAENTPLYAALESTLAVKYNERDAFVILFGLTIARVLEVKRDQPEFYKSFQKIWIEPLMHVLCTDKPEEAIKLILEDTKEALKND